MIREPDVAHKLRRTSKDMALKNEERVTATRARLIDAAINALAEIGYHRTTFVEVSRRSELSRGAIHHHFESIPDLMAAVTRDISDRIQRSVREGLSQLPDNVDVFDAGIDFVWLQMQQAPYRALDQIRAALATDLDLQSSVKDEVVDVAEWLQRQARNIVAEGNSAPEAIDPAVIRLVLSTLSGAATYDIALGPPPEDPDRSAYLATLKSMVRLYNAERARANVPPEPATA